MRVVVTRLGIMIDQLCFEVLGADNQRIVETALDLNPGLSDILARNGHRLPLNQVVLLPEPTAVAATDLTIKLWD